MLTADDRTAWASGSAAARHAGGIAQFRRPMVMVLALFYALGIRFAYVDHIAPLLHHQGEIDLYPGLGVSLLGVLAAAAPAALLPILSAYPGMLIVWLFYLLVYVPSSIVPLHATNYEVNGYPIFIFFLGSNLLGLAWLATRRIELPRLAAFLSNTRRYLATIGSVALVVEVFLLVSVGLQLPVMGSLEEIYGAREAVFDRLWMEGLVATGYLLQLQSNAVLPVLTALALARRNWLLLGATFIGQYVLFLVMAQKSPVGVFLFQLFLHSIASRPAWAVARMVGVFSVSVWLLLAIDSIFDAPELVFATVRRAATTNGLLTGYYFDFFRDADYAYFQQTILGGVGIASAYATSYKVIIGSIYSWPGASANANFWADGFANLGWIGVLLVTALLGLVLVLLNGVVRPSQFRLVFVAMGGVVLVLANTGLHTAIFSGGLLLALVLIYVLPEDAVDRAAAA